LQLASIHFSLSASEQRAVRRLLGLLADIERKMAAAQDPIVSQDFLGHEVENQQGLNPGNTEQQVHVLGAQKATVSEVRSTDSINFPPLTSQLYQKIPHPLSSAIKEMTTIDGSCIDRLWQFVLKAWALSKMGQFNIPVIYEILFPFCKGEALHLLMQARAQNLPFETFHASLIRHFIPDRQLAQLRMDTYERVQAEHEPLSKYVQDIRDAALVLQIKESEALVVSRILKGLNHHQRARFVFQPLPTTLAQLEHLIVEDRNIAYADSIRPQSRQNVRVGVVNAQAAQSPRRENKTRPAKKNIVCFRCGKHGHIQRNCNVRLAQQRQPKVVARTQS
jgi:hypothetical protein